MAEGRDKLKNWWNLTKDWCPRLCKLNKNHLNRSAMRCITLALSCCWLPWDWDITHCLLLGKMLCYFAFACVQSACHIFNWLHSKCAETRVIASSWNLLILVRSVPGLELGLVFWLYVRHQEHFYCVVFCRCSTPHWTLQQVQTAAMWQLPVPRHLVISHSLSSLVQLLQELPYS